MWNLLNMSLIPVMIAAIVLLPFTGYCMDMRREVIPIIQMLQEGKAKISADKKSIIDENGHIVGNETTDLTLPTPKPAANSPDTAKENTPPPPQLFHCSKKCAVISRHCYKDENQNIVCINTCDKESLICE